MNVLITHECSGVVREAFRAVGCDAWSCDLKQAEDGSPFHIVGDAIEAINRGGWDLIGMHCECRYLCGSGLHWNARRPERAKMTEEAFAHVMDCVNAAKYSGAKWYLENSVGILSTRWLKPDQIIQPYQFGDDARKATCLWLSGLPLLEIDPASRKPGRLVNGKERWSNQTDSGQNRLAPSVKRSADRARTYSGIANAIALQWAK